VDKRATSDLQPLVSVIVTCFNHARFLGQAVDSARCQTWRSLEVVVVDDGSTDHTPEVIERYPQIISLRQQNLGPSAARNAGLRASHGRYVLFLDADDMLLPSALEYAVHEISAHPECGFISGGYREVDADGRALGEPKVSTVSADHHVALLSRINYIAMHATVLYRREALLQIGGFDPTLRVYEDYDVYLKIARQFPIRHFPELMALYRRHDDNTTRNAVLMLRGLSEVMARQKHHLGTDPRLRAAYKTGIHTWTVYHQQHLKESFNCLRRYGRRMEGIKGIAFLLRLAPWQFCRAALEAGLRRVLRTVRLPQ
jgi:glycosyltransferase involved in cell wall biosynthesis